MTATRSNPARQSSLHTSLHKKWYWLLLVPYIAALAIPFYNSIEPTLFGMPFFYWYQLLWVALTSPIVALVFKLSHKTDKR